MRRVVILAMVLGALATDSLAAGRPNILFAIADDATWRHFGMGASFWKLPTLIGSIDCGSAHFGK